MSAIRETIAEKKQRARSTLRRLRAMYPRADCALKHESAWQLLVSTILSAQSTDETVNRVTTELYRKYRSPAAMAQASQEELEADIHSTGFFRQKAKNIRATSQMVAQEFAGQVPDTMDDLLRLPGVARKTANVVLGTWFGKNEGVVVDTHVGRISERLGLTWTGRHGKDAVRIENDLMELIPRKDWTFFGHALISHGRRVCFARKPDCSSCKLSNLCPSAFTIGGKAPAGPANRKSRTKAGK